MKCLGFYCIWCGKRLTEAEREEFQVCDSCAVKEIRKGITDLVMKK